MIRHQATIATIIVLMIALQPISATPKPKPLPSFDLNKLQGDWYINFSTTMPINDLTCFVWSLDVVSNQSVPSNLTVYYDGQNQARNFDFIPQTPNSIWNYENNTYSLTFIGLDEAKWSSGMIADSSGEDNIMIFSKYANAS